MTTLQHIANQRPMPTEGERYKAASEQLRKQLGNDKVYQEANAWALWLCNEAEHTDTWHDPHEISQQERVYLRDWDTASRAAKTLAGHLEKGDWDGARVDEAARLAGIKPISNSKEAFTKMLRELAKQPVSLHQRLSSRGMPFLCGPLLVVPPGERLRLPSKSMSLAFALVYGFKKLTGAVERKPASAAGRRPVSGTDECFRGLYFRNSVYHRFDLLSGGKPCYDAVTQFVNATFDTDLDMSAIIRSCNRCKRRVYVATKFMESVDDRDIKARK